ncbi:MAG TPA: hypothetical protein VJH92_03195 [Candidatus Nanoarchaeia archaeon]|nr:hypothetical protein [Candidatus Nanoarchaeia archaeon]
MPELKKIKEVDNPLFKRKEVQFSIHSNITPSNSESEKLIAGKFSVGQEVVAVKKIQAKFGSNNFLIDANVYASRDDKIKTEPKKKEKKK